MKYLLSVNCTILMGLVSLPSLAVTSVIHPNSLKMTKISCAQDASQIVDQIKKYKALEPTVGCPPNDNNDNISSFTLPKISENSGYFYNICHKKLCYSLCAHYGAAKNSSICSWEIGNWNKTFSCTKKMVLPSCLRPKLH